MKRFYIVLFSALVFLPLSISFAQTANQGSDAGRSVAVYLSPKNGDSYVPAKSTLVLRISQDVPGGASSSNFSFIVTGQKSGIHTGKVVFSDDNRTVIFKPDLPFVLNELVNVSISIEGSEHFAPVTYQFRTTEMTEAERDEVLMQIRKNELIEAQENPVASLAKNHDEILHDLHNDSLPCFYHVDTIKNPSPGNIFFSAVNLFSGTFSFIGIFNNFGSPAFYKNIPKGCENFQRLSDNTFSYFAQTSNPQPGVSLGTGIINRIDTDGNLLDIFQCGNGYTTDYHEFELLPNGHAIVVSFDPEYVDMTKIISDTAAKTHAKVSGAIIQELDKDKNVVFQWRSWDHCKITDATHENLTAAAIDYVHMNTARVDSDGNIVASFRHMDEIMKISRTDSNTIWRWGGKNNQFTFLDDTLQFSHQHNPIRIANGHITLWDNGNYRLIDTNINGKDTIVNKPFSRALEYEVDEIHHTAKAVWDFRNVPFSVAGGNVQRLANGNTFMDFGLSTFPNMMEITPQGEKVFQISLDYGAWCYRAYKYPEMIVAGVKTSNQNSFGIGGIYPNPAENMTTISYFAASGIVEITLSDVLGHIVRSSKQIAQAGANNFPLDIHGLSRGTYYCRISENESSSMKMLVVQ